MPIDPAVIAALDGATVAQLREDARVAFTTGLLCVHLDEAARHYRLAALALAVARIADTSDVRVEQAWTGNDFLCLDIPMPVTHTMGEGGCDLIPALAALLRSAP